MPFVLDASVALAWAFEDETSLYTDRILGLLASDVALVPEIWPLEIANGTLAAERRGRSAPADIIRFSTLVRGLPLQIDHSSLDQVFTQILDVARTHALSIYDASYLELAMREGLPLATQDVRLRAAAEAAGTPLL